MTLTKITPHETKRLLDAGAVLIDVRGPDEHARERIAAARNVPLGAPATIGGAPVVFHCKGGMRTAANEAALAGTARGKAYMLDGGIDAWKQAGLPVVTDRTKPIDIMRQVQIVAGSLVLLGIVLGFAVRPEFSLLSGAVGAGLIFAGVSGWCGTAKLLERMPWNKRAPA